MRRAVACFTLLASTAYAVNTGEVTLRGYTSEHAAAEVQWEQKFREMPDPARVRENMRRMSARPHHVGSPYDKDNAEWLLAQLKSYGLDAKIEQFEALFPTPKSRKLELLGPEKFEATLDEPVVKVDPTSDQKKEQLPTYNAYSRDGDVTAPLVYVNYGAPADYEELAAMGVSVKGAIVIARYGQTWRGIKPKVAAEHGAVGCIIYSDPRDDGYFRGDTYPDGPMRPARRGAAWQRDGYAGVSGRSADSGHRRSGRREADSARSGADDYEDSCAADLLCGRDTVSEVAARRTGAGELARRAAVRVQGRPERRDGASCGQLQLGSQAALRRDRDDSRFDVFPISGSFAATTMMPG